MKPLILITSGASKNIFSLNCSYCQKIEQNGGIPFILPAYSEISANEILERANGILLSGGGDINPLIWGEEPENECGEILPERDYFEIEIAKEAYIKKIPVFGICRGAQIMAVAAGGEIIQHIPNSIPNPIKHSQSAPKYCPTHTIKTVEGTIIQSLMGKKATVNSFHHQAVKTTGDSFIISAYSPDGVVEAIESNTDKTGFAIGVQWHPEHMVSGDVLFKRFVDESSKSYYI